MADRQIYVGIDAGVLHEEGTESYYVDINAGVLTEDQAAVGGSHSLTATGIATAAPTVGSPALSQVHAITATGIATAAPTVGAPALTQAHVVTATGIATGAPTVGSPALSQLHVVTATGIATAAPTVGSPALNQVHAFTATGVSTGAPTVGSPVATHPVWIIVGFTATAVPGAIRLNGTTSANNIEYLIQTAPGAAPDPNTAATDRQAVTPNTPFEIDVSVAGDDYRVDARAVNVG